MKIIPGSKKRHYMARASIFLIVAALIAGMAGCGPVQYNLTISSTEGGEVTIPGEGTFTYDEGTLVEIVAEPEESYLFVNWTDEVDTIANVYAATTTITMSGDYYITANFASATEIWDWYGLNATRNDPASNYVLMNDLDSTTPGYEELASPTANDGKGWQPIGGWDARFTGSLDGRGYEIRNLFIDRPDENDAGLFGAVEQPGVIKNIGMTNATVIGKNLIGGLAGFNGGTVSNSYSSSNVTGGSPRYHVGGLLGGNEGTVINSYSTGSVTGGGWVGGLVGTNIGTVSNSYSSSNVTSNGDLIGGLMGVNEGTVTNSYSTGNVTGNLGVGGLVGANGYADPGTVSNSYSTGSVTGESYVGGLVGGSFTEGNAVSNSYSTGIVAGTLSVGGLVGGNQHSTVTDSYSIGNVTGVDNVGGLVGENLIDGDLSNSYSTGSVIGDVNVGGLVGLNEEGTVNNSFWDTQTSGQATSDGGTGKTTAEMRDIATFSAWDIIAVADPGTRNPSYTWNIVNGVAYPFLSWQP